MRGLLVAAVLFATLGLANAKESMLEFVFETIGGRSHRLVAIVFAVALMITGLAATFFGSRVLGIMKSVFSYFAAFTLVFYAARHSLHDDVVLLSLCCAVGVAFSVISSLVAKVAYITFGLTGSLLLTTLLHLTILPSLPPHTTTPLAITAFCVLAVVMVFAVYKLFVTACVVLVAFAGAFAFVIGLDLVTAQTISHRNIDSGSLSGVGWALVALWIVLGVLGCLIQLFPKSVKKFLHRFTHTKKTNNKQRSQMQSKNAILQPLSPVSQSSYQTAQNTAFFGGKKSRISVGGESSVFSGIVVGGGVGLQNMGNTCFMNACVQALFSVDNIREEYIRIAREGNSGEMAKSFGTIMHMLKESPYPSIKPRELRSIGERVGFADGLQHDSCEFMRALVNAVIDEDNLANGASAMKRELGFETQGTVTCDECGCESRLREEAIDVSLQMPHSPNNGNVHTIESLINYSFRPTELTGDNMFFCDNCKRLTTARRVSHITSLPHTLILSLNRFSYCTTTQTMRKRTDAVFIRPTLRLGSRTFHLHGVVCHAGSQLNSGHFFAFARRPVNKNKNNAGQFASDTAVVCVVEEDTNDQQSGVEWVKLDDACVRGVSLEEVLEVCSSSFATGSAYVLVYSQL